MDLSLDGDEFLFDLSRDQRERANRVRHEPERLAMMRALLRGMGSHDGAPTGRRELLAPLCQGRPTAILSV